MKYKAGDVLMNDKDERIDILFASDLIYVISFTGSVEVPNKLNTWGYIEPKYELVEKIEIVKASEIDEKRLYLIKE